MTLSAHNHPASAIVVFCSCPDDAVADSIATELVRAKLSACVQVLPPMRSIYRWQDKICQENESLLVIKSVTSLWTKLSATVKQWHPYDVPELLAVPVVAIDSDYAAWLGINLRS